MDSPTVVNVDHYVCAKGATRATFKRLSQLVHDWMRPNIRMTSKFVPNRNKDAGIVAKEKMHVRCTHDVLRQTATVVQCRHQGLSDVSCVYMRVLHD